jgi:hypothetical protein
MIGITTLGKMALGKMALFKMALGKMALVMTTLSENGNLALQHLAL